MEVSRSSKGSKIEKKLPDIANSKKPMVQSMGTIYQSIRETSFSHSKTLDELERRLKEEQKSNFELVHLPQHRKAN